MHNTQELVCQSTNQMSFGRVWDSGHPYTRWEVYYTDKTPCKSPAASKLSHQVESHTVIDTNVKASGPVEPEEPGQHPAIVTEALAPPSVQPGEGEPKPAAQKKEERVRKGTGLAKPKKQQRKEDPPDEAGGLGRALL